MSSRMILGVLREFVLSPSANWTCAFLQYLEEHHIFSPRHEIMSIEPPNNNDSILKDTMHNCFRLHEALRIPSPMLRMWL